MKNINIILSHSKNFVIGYDNNIPWFYEEEFQYFNNTTTSKTNKKNAVIIGYNTFNNIQTSLKNRINVIIDKTVDETIIKNELVFVNSLSRAILYCKNNDEINDIFIIGGEKIYNEALKRNDINNLYICYVNIDIIGNKYINKDYLENYTLTNRYNCINEPTLTFKIFEKKSDEIQYINLIKNVLDNGVFKNDRTNSGILSYFGNTMRFNIENSFPLLTTKKMFLRGIIEELLWFINGKTDAKLLQAKKVKIWDGNSSREFLDSIGLNHYEDGDCGPIYGFNFRHYGAQYVDCHADYTGMGYDQLQNIINTIKENPNSRRILINLWNPCDLDKVVLPPCHVLYQFWVYDGKISCSLYQRSGDIGLGVPFNIASASLLTYLIGHLTGLKPFELIHTIGDGHIYSDHIEAMKTQITREPYDFPKLIINDRKQNNIEDFIYDDFKLVDYQCHDKIVMMMK